MAASHGRHTAKLLPEATLERIGLAFDIDFCEAVLRSQPENLAALEALGNAYTRVGKIDEGLEIDRRLVRLLPESAVAHYNLACSLSLLARVDEAVETLERAVRLGYRDFDYLERDPDLENVRRDARYKAIVSSAK